MVKKIPAEQRLIKANSGKERVSILETPARVQLNSNSKPEEIMSFFKSIQTNEKAVNSYILELENFAQRKLEEAGIDYNHVDFLAGIQDKELEPVWFAAKILAEARCLRKFIEEKDFFNAIHSALLMEGARGDYNFSTFEPEALIGLEKVRDGEKSAKYSKERKDGWLKQAKILLSNKANNYRLNNGKPNYTEIALQIQLDEQLLSKAHRSICDHLRNNK